MIKRQMYGRRVTQPGVLDAADAVLTGRAAAVAQPQVGELPARASVAKQVNRCHQYR
jgi:hypothetical protein